MVFIGYFSINLLVIVCHGAVIFIVNKENKLF